jgi:putative DNA primase/helicase
VSKTFASFLGAHALENVPGKTFLGISDSRPDPKLSKQAVERLLSISGEDPQDVNPKGKTPFTAKLICKIGIASNIIADFADPTGALLSRFLFVETTKSYAANPDPTLLSQILTQQNEITWWFLRGLRRLLQNGKYTEPQNELRDRFKLQNNPIPCFIAARCQVTSDANHKLSRESLYEEFGLWCADAQVNCLDKNVFFRDLYSMYPGVKAHERFVSGIMFLAV